MMLPLLLLAVAPSFDAQACGTCHEEAFEAWSASRHAVAGTNAVYTASHALEPMRWCDGCHAPQGVSEGVTCATCHVQDGAVVTARPLTEDGLQAHPMRQQPALAQSEACASCHQFNFPVSRHEPVTASAFVMQNTFEEWRASGSEKSCQACHGAHQASGAHDQQALQAALNVTLRCVRPHELELTLLTRGVPHQFPTGDPYRRLELAWCEDAACLVPLGRHTLEREVRPFRESWRVMKDTTVPPSGLAVSLPLPVAARHLKLTYRYASRGSEEKVPEDERAVVLFNQPLPGECR